ncbi:MAG TPA: response regulator, partial [Crenalkalicoccus sp.]|nr:response regulator [Crenalkalicoccus sp.]
VVEDEALIAMALQDILEGAQARVAVALTREQAMAEIGGDRFDAAVVDLALDGNSGGREVIAALRARWPRLPIVVSSAWPEAASVLRQQPPPGPAPAVLQKPWRAEAMLAAVQAAIAGLSGRGWSG